MATSVHLPQALLDALDRRAKYLRISRNRLIVQALERELRATDEWSPGFFERLEETDAATAAAVEEMLDAVLRARRSKKPRRL
ncbi:MAG: ribbon-helix-helix protein, CopG family [Polyangiaceae bacterium]|nr:ribbon-helix-helix protein, CopG family [Polyangiaceae bacterium]